MPILRRKVNKNVKKLHEARKADKTKTWVSHGELAGNFDMEGIVRVQGAQKKLNKAVKARGKGPVGALRKIVAGEKANAKRGNIAAIRKLRTTHNGLAGKLLGKMRVGQEIEITSKRGNVREAKLRGSSPDGAMIYIEQKGQEKAVLASRVDRISKI